MSEGFDKTETVSQNYDLLYDEMCKELNLLTDLNLKYSALCKSALSTVKNYLIRLKIIMQGTGFPSRSHEINFFKEIKPKFYSHWIYWIEISKIEIRRPIGNTTLIQHYLNEQMQTLSDFFYSSLDFYQYYRSEDTFLDEIYFLRKGFENNIDNNSYLIDFDRSFSTSHDFLVSKILANEMISDYLNKQLLQLEEKELGLTSLKTNLNWTAPKVALAELIYAFYAAGVFNNSQIDVGRLSEQICLAFNVKLSYIFKTFEEIRLRKKNRTAFIDFIKKMLLQKMEEDDEQAF